MLLLDSDCVVERGGWLQELVAPFDEESLLYAVGMQG